MKNQPAFPNDVTAQEFYLFTESSSIKEHGQFRAGMDMRDYFAAKAMAANVVAYSQATGNSPSDVAIAEWSYHLADAMLEARKAP